MQRRHHRFCFVIVCLCLFCSGEFESSHQSSSEFFSRAGGNDTVLAQLPHTLAYGIQFEILKIGGRAQNETLGYEPIFQFFTFREKSAG